MKTEPQRIFSACAAGLMLIAVAGACSRHDAPPPEQPIASKPESLSIEVARNDAPPAADPALAARERELALKESELARRERELTRERAAAPVTPRHEIDPTLRDREIEPLRAPVREAEPVVERDVLLVTLPASTRLQVEFLDDLSSDTSAVGDRFTARVVEDVVHDGYRVIPAGSRVEGTVAEAVPSKKIGGQARLALAFDRLELPGGEGLDLSASVAELGKKQTKKDAATIGGAAAAGAILGRVLSNDNKGKGTVLGAIVGAAAGTAIASKTAGDPAVVPSGTLSELALDEPLEVAVKRSAASDRLASR